MDRGKPGSKTHGFASISAISASRVRIASEIEHTSVPYPAESSSYRLRPGNMPSGVGRSANGSPVGRRTTDAPTHRRDGVADYAWALRYGLGERGCVAFGKAAAGDPHGFLQVTRSPTHVDIVSD
ncbi:hypothetical protein GCM10017688_16560 [Streptomyces ramulosus]